MKKILLALVLVLPSVLMSGTISVGSPWGGIHNSEEDRGLGTIGIDDSEALELNNMDLSDNGTILKKRGGYNVINGNLDISTQPVRGGVVFVDSGGTQNVLFATHDSIYRTDDFIAGSFSQIVSTDTIGSYYDFAVNNGVAWRANSSRDQILSYDGTSVTYYPSLPQGDQIEFISDRAIISGTSANKNRLHFSGAADFTNFTTGIEETSPFTEDIGFDGDVVTSVKSACGGVVIFSESSVYIWTGVNQFDARIDVITNRLGTTQPNTVFERDGKVYFQATDYHVYEYDCNVFRKLSGKIKKSNLGGLFQSSEKRHFLTFDRRDRLWLSVPDPLTSPNNDDTLIYDTRNDAWLRYSFSAQAALPAIDKTSDVEYMLFGGPSTGAVFSTFNDFARGCENDAIIGAGCSGGSSFTANFDTKYFIGESPFTEDSWDKYSVLVRTPGTSETFSFQYDVDRTGSYTSNNFSLSSTGYLYTVLNDKFPVGTVGNLIGLRFQCSDDPASCEIYGFELHYTPKTWRVQSP